MILDFYILFFSDLLLVFLGGEGGSRGNRRGWLSFG